MHALLAAALWCSGAGREGVNDRISDQLETAMRRELQMLRDRRDAIDGEIARIVEFLGWAGVNPAYRKPPRSARGYVKKTLHALLVEVAGAGLNAAVAVQMAEQRGQVLDRGTASSLLSRWKRDGAVIHEGGKYRLKDQPRRVALVASRA
jgi:hypothetical protein